MRTLVIKTLAIKTMFETSQIIEIYNMPAVLSKSATFPTACLPADEVREKWNGTILIPDYAIKGLYGSLKGDVYRLKDFKITDGFVFDHIDMFVPKKSEKAGFTFCPSMFEGIECGFTDNSFIMEVPDDRFVSVGGKLELRLTYEFPY
ncbi:MAG: hypothetical protein IJ794_10145 [Lachnospiraceae bacterium]|nr:hypothetical protein [Lachnospiraceae bacterium]